MMEPNNPNDTRRVPQYSRQEQELIRQLMPDVSRWRPLIKFCLLELALVFIIIMLARPQEAGSISSEERRGIETVICIDVSNSMRAQDVSPDRLTRAKMMIENMIERFSNDKIGIIVFAGDAFLQITNIQSISDSYLAESSQYQSRAFEVNNQLSIARFIKSYINDPKHERDLIPSNSGLTNMGVETSIQEYNALVLKRDNMLRDAGTNNPLIIDLNNSIDAMKVSINRSMSLSSVAVPLAYDPNR